jgi:threonine dehydratase
MITIEETKLAQKMIAPFVVKTELATVNELSKTLGMNIYLKMENQQNSGSFKMRGACYKILTLNEEERKNGVIAASAGNHAQGVACTATKLGIPSTIVMPTTSPISKIKATRDYGANVVLYGNSYDEAYQKACEIQKATKATFVHPYNDEKVMIGQGTIALEILEQLPNVDAIIVPVGGGGLISGVASVAKQLKPSIKIIGVETENAPSMKQSLENHQITSIKTKPSLADGITVGTPGSNTFPIIQKYVDEIVTVSETSIASSILLLLEKQKTVSEGSGACPIAALLSYPFEDLKGKNVVCLVSGGNIDVNVIENIINLGLLHDGRRFNLDLIIDHKAGELQKLLHVIFVEGGNLLSIEQSRYLPQLGVREQEVHLVIEAFDRPHQVKIKEAVLQQGYHIIEGNQYE